MKRKQLIYGGIIGLLVVLYVVRLSGVGLGSVNVGGIPTAGAIEEAQKEVRSLQVRLKELYNQERERDDKRLALVDRTAPFWRVTGDRLPTTEVQTRIQRLAMRSNVKLGKVGAPRTLELSDDLQTIEVQISTTTSVRDFAEFAKEVENHVPMLDFHDCSIRPNEMKDPDSIRVSGRIRAYVLSSRARDYLAGNETTLGTEEATP